MAVTMKDVAREAGVAASTVSLVLNQKGYVAEETRRRVQAAMDRLHYVPSQMARNLSLNRTNIIGLIVPTVAHPFFGELAEHLETALAALDYQMMLCSTQNQKNSEGRFIEMLKRHTMDGLIMGAHSLEVGMYEQLDYPVIAFDRYLNDSIPIVHCDHVYGGQLAAEAFLKHNCQHIVEIEGFQGVRTPANEYHSSFHNYLHQHGIITDVLEMPWNAFSYTDFLTSAEQLFDTYPDVDGIFGSDMAIASCMRVAARRGYSIPEQLKLVAYDGTAMTQMGIQPVTAVRQPLEELARLAARKIVNKVQGVEDNLPWVIQPCLLQGETC